MKEFLQVAESFRTLAKTYIINRSKPAYKTGNLMNTVYSYNTPNRMLKSTSTKKGGKIKIETPKVFITLNYAPPGAEYGKFVEEGTSKMKARPFAEEAAKDPLLKRQIDNAVNGIIQTTIMNAIDIGFKRAFRKLPS
jgi:HK97 gp10 family phage protein